MAQPSPHRADPGPFDIERIGAGLPALALAPQIRGWLGTCADDPRDGAAVSAPRAAAPGGTPAGAPALADIALLEVPLEQVTAEALQGRIDAMPMRRAGQR